MTEKNRANRPKSLFFNKLRNSLNEKRLPKRVKIVSEHIGILSECQKIVPEHIRILPERQKILPEYIGILPERQKIVPED